MFKGSILLPLGILFLCFGGWEAPKSGLTEHAVLLLAMGTLDIVFCVGRMVNAKSR